MTSIVERTFTCFTGATFAGFSTFAGLRDLGAAAAGAWLFARWPPGSSDTYEVRTMLTAVCDERDIDF